MSGVEFWQSRMGHTFYEGTMPSLVRELKKLNENLEKAGEIALYGSEVVTKSDKPLAEVLKQFERFRMENSAAVPDKSTKPTGHTPEFYYDLLKQLSREAQQSGEAAGHLIGDHLIDLWADQPHPDGEGERDSINLVIAELQNIEEWAASIRKKLEQEL